jgi:hypothetical protein
VQQAVNVGAGKSSAAGFQLLLVRRDRHPGLFWHWISPSKGARNVHALLSLPF